MLRRVRREVLDQLPPRTDTRVPVELTEAQRSEHDDLIQPIAVLLRRGRVRPLTQTEFLRLMQLLTTQRIICNGLAQLRFDELWPTLGAAGVPPEGTLDRLDSPKLVELRELLRHLVVDSGQKVVVFSQWRRMLQLASWSVGDLLSAAGLRAAFFSGDESQPRRTQNVIEFHDDPTLAVLFATDAGGVGLNLQRAASAVVNLELPWNPAVLEQRVGRVYRLGQKSPVQVFNLIAESGIEAHIAKLVGDKQALFSGLFDGTSDEVRFTSSGGFLDRVEQLFEPPSAPELPPLDEAEQEVDEVAPAAAVELPAVVPTVEQPPTTAAPVGPAPPPPPAGDIRQLLAGLQVARTADGGLRIEAPPAAAGTLAAMFQTMATLLAAAASDEPA
jgi:SNF2 family DNA or RNA helicase